MCPSPSIRRPEHVDGAPAVVARRKQVAACVQHKPPVLEIGPTLFLALAPPICLGPGGLTSLQQAQGVRDGQTPSALPSAFATLPGVQK